MAYKNREDLIALFSKTSVIRGRDLTKLGFSRMLVSSALKRGEIERIDRGLYTAPQVNVTENHTCVEIASKIPDAVFCLLTACRIHGITMQSPSDVWFARSGNAWTPKITFVKTRMVRFRGAAYTKGIETITCEGVEIKVYSIAKTVADLFRFRNKYGLDIALEALRDVLYNKRCSIDELIRYAKIRGVYKVLAVYINAYMSS